ncbi:MAG: PIN domain-containing protein [Euryarchaeota archaeon]|nr:PIN domain-containing protein [Euryarchaeota archaeon]
MGEARFQDLAGVPGVTTRLNLMEVYYIIKHRGGNAREVFLECLPNTIGFTDEDLMAAMDWRSEHFQKRTREFSYVDALGYRVALSHGLTFTTGDHKFSGYPGAEIVR